MTLRTFCYLSILLVALTACGQGGGEAEIVRTTDIYLERQVSEQRQEILSEVPGRVLDSLEWMQGDQRVYTVLSSNSHPLDPEAGIYLSHYRVGVGGTRKLWQYLDTLDCRENRFYLENLLPEIRIRAGDGDLPQAIALAYDLGCHDGSQPHLPNRRMMLIDSLSGIPLITVEGLGGLLANHGAGLLDFQELEAGDNEKEVPGGITNFDALERLPLSLRRELFSNWMDLFI